MPTPLIRKIDPRDLQKNTAIGISLPLNGGSVFNKTFTTQEQIKYNLINCILTSKGERILNPEFGSEIRKFLFEGLTEDNIDLLKASIETTIINYVSEVQVDDIVINEYNDNSITVAIKYHIKASGNEDSITIDFN